MSLIKEMEKAAYDEAIKKMKLKFINLVIIIVNLLLLSQAGIATAQPEQIIDQVTAVIGNKILLKSEIETQYQQIVSQGTTGSEELRCRVTDQLLINKLLLNQAILDSVEVTDNQVENELDRRVGYMVSQIGSEAKLEEYYEKSILEIKDEFKPLIMEQLLMQAMQGTVTKNVSVSPSDVKEFFNSIPEDSLPFINAEIEYSQIVINVPVSNEEKKNVKDKLESYRQRVLKGEEFSTLAILYSQDGSSRNGGELGFVGRGDLVPEFEAAAFKLRKGEVSEIVETKFGFHIIQLIERRGEQINVRHILLKPAFSAPDINKTFAKSDSIHKLIISDSLSFSEAAQRFSNDADSRFNGGNVVNQKLGTTRFEADEVDPTVFFQLEKMNVGETSAPIQSLSAEGNTAFKILFLKSRSKPHKANLTTDYQRIQEATLTEKESKALVAWVKKKKRTTFVQLSDDLKSCVSLEHWFAKD
ncbi:MAG: peptidylprolyl isomerase [Bacteroidetes bacterium]|nr:peptidylprolyl isomerase [Bacteroidota bacterium]